MNNIVLKRWYNKIYKWLRGNNMSNDMLMKELQNNIERLKIITHEEYTHFEANGEHYIIYDDDVFCSGTINEVIIFIRAYRLGVSHERIKNNHKHING